MKIIGITGIFGVGKTTASKFFSHLGAEIIDADKISHRILNNELQAKQKIITYFGKDILDNYGKIDRRRLARQVFNNKKKLLVLSNILHPEITKKIKSKLEILKRNNPKTIVVIDAPLLIEAKLQDVVEKIIVVRTDYEIIVKRCKANKRLAKLQIDSRIKNQLKQKEKLKYADYIIDNNGTLSKTKKQAEKIWKKEVKEWI